MSELPHRTDSSRKTFLTETQAIHRWEDGEITQDITHTADPAAVRDFMQKIIRYYESDVPGAARSIEEIYADDAFPRDGTDPREALPMYAKVEDDGFVYIRDSEGGEYVMWAVEEWILPREDMEFDFRAWNRADTDPLEDDRTGINEDTLATILKYLILTYEHPSEVKERFGRAQFKA